MRLETIERDLEIVADDLRQEARGDLASAPPMAGQGGANEYPLRAALLLLSAKFGDYDFERLKPAAVGVELLDLAVQKHYPRSAASSQPPVARVQGPGVNGEGRRPKDEEQGILRQAQDKPGTRISKFGTRNSELGRAKPITNNEFLITNSDLQPLTSDNLALITGDYYYARAVSLGSTFDDTRIVKIMVQAISEIAQGEVESQRSLNESTLKKLASLYSTSCHLGALIGGVSEKMTKALKKYGLNLGVAYRLTSEMHEKGEPQKFLTLAKKALADLPVNKYRVCLEQLAMKIYSSWLADSMVWLPVGLDLD